MAIEKTIVLKADTTQASKGIEKLDKDVKGVESSSKGAKSGFLSLTGVTQKLGLAFKALGIGLIVTAFMKLKDIFSGNIETARLFERISARLSATFDVLRDRTENFIRALIDLKNPFKAFKDSFTGTTAEIREETKAINEFTKSLQLVRDQERELVVERAKANKVIAESRLLAEDETKTLQSRLTALKEAIKVENEIAEKELETQQLKVDNLQAIIDLGKSSEQDLIDLENERARLIDLQTASTLRQKRVKTEINTFEREIQTEKKKRENEILKIEQDKQKEIEKELALEKKAQNELLALKQKEANELIALETKKAEEKENITKQKLETLKQMEISGAQSILSALNQLAGEGTALAKATALTQILINSAQAVSGAIKAGAGVPFPGNLGAIATGVGAVLSGIASAKNIFAKADSSEAGSIDTQASISQGQVQSLGSLVPNISAIETPDLGNEPIQAFVVENDISNSQALQEQLQIQATL